MFLWMQYNRTFKLDIYIWKKILKFTSVASSFVAFFSSGFVSGFFLSLSSSSLSSDDSSSDDSSSDEDSSFFLSSAFFIGQIKPLNKIKYAKTHYLTSDLIYLICAYIFFISNEILKF